MKSAAVVGAGSWGTAFAAHLVRRGVDTVLISRRSEVALHMRKYRVNPDYVDMLRLPTALKYATLSDADLADIDLVVMAVPSQHYRATAASLKDRIPRGLALLSLAKGLDPGSRLRLSQIAEQELGRLDGGVAVLSGPNHAEEISLGQPSATVIASASARLARTLQEVISDANFRVYLNNDLIGVELAGAVKNVVALACGMSDGLGYGDNARAALITRGLAEMARFGVAQGAEAKTFSGLAGLGDMVATCTSHHSRNRLAGELLAQGYAPVQVESEIHMVAEGLTAAPVVLELARELGIDMPITEDVVRVIREGKDVKACVTDLMNRAPRDEDY